MVLSVHCILALNCAPIERCPAAEAPEDGEIAAQLQGMIGSQSAQVIEEIIEGANKPVSGVVATVFGIATLLAGASGVFGALQDGLNTVWDVTPKPGRGILRVIKDRFLSLTMVLGVGFLLLVSLLVSGSAAAFGKYVGRWFAVVTFAGAGTPQLSDHLE